MDRAHSQRCLQRLLARVVRPALSVQLDGGQWPLGADDARSGHFPWPTRGRRRALEPPPQPTAVSQLVDRGDGDHRAHLDDADTVTEPLDEVELVRGEQHWDNRIGSDP